MNFSVNPHYSEHSGNMSLNLNMAYSPSNIINIIISNVATTFRTGSHLNLSLIASDGTNVKYKPEQGKVMIKLPNPTITATIWSSGKVLCTGAISEEEAKVGAQMIVQWLQGQGFGVTLSDFRVVNVLAVCYLPFGINLVKFTRNNQPIAKYEPELHPGVNYRIADFNTLLQLFSTGTVTIIGPSVDAALESMKRVYPLLLECHRPLQGAG